MYLPETDFDKQAFLAVVQEKWAKGRGLLVTVSEGHPLCRRFSRGRLGHCGRLRPQDPRRCRPDPQRHDHAGDGTQVPLEKPGLLDRVSVALCLKWTSGRPRRPGAAAVRAAMEW